MMRRIANEALGVLSKFVDEKAAYSDPEIETDPGKILERVEFIEQVFPDVVVVVCSRDRVSYVSRNCFEIIGHRDSEFRSLSLMQTLDLLHEDDVEGFQRCVEKLMRVTTKEYDRYKFIISYRMKDCSGVYRVIEDEKVAVRTVSGKYVFVTLLRSAPNHNTFLGVSLRIQKKSGHTFILMDEFVPQSKTSPALSHRQMDIVNLVAMGCSNQDIADRLHLSLSTVKNHKQVVFKKIKARNSMEMVNRVRRGKLS